MQNGHFDTQEGAAVYSRKRGEPTFVYEPSLTAERILVKTMEEAKRWLMFVMSSVRKQRTNQKTHSVFSRGWRRL